MLSIFRSGIGAVGVACAAALLTGCDASMSAAGSDLGPNEANRLHATSIALRSDAREVASDRPSLIFASSALRELERSANVAPGFEPGDWEYGRNDSRLGAVGPVIVARSAAWRIDQRETISEFDGRLRVIGRRTIRSTRYGWE